MLLMNQIVYFNLHVHAQLRKERKSSILLEGGGNRTTISIIWVKSKVKNNFDFVLH